MWITAESKLAWLRFPGWAQTTVSFWMQCPRFELHSRELENSIARERWVNSVVDNKSKINVTFQQGHGKKPIEVCGLVTDGYIQGPYLMFTIDTLCPVCRETDFVTECGARLHIKAPDRPF